MTLLYMLLPAAMALWAYRQGLRDGMARERGKPPAPVITPPKRKPKPSPEQKRWEQIIDNAEKYDGTANGQKKVTK